VSSNVFVLLKPAVLVPWLLGMAFGVFLGATPGLTATMGVALVVPISFYLPPDAGLALIIGVSFTAIFAGDIPATWLRIPGTPASAAATLDSHALAQKGRGEFALRLNLVCSCLGGLVGVLLLAWLAPLLARAAIRFSDYEYFWLGVLGLSLAAAVSVGSTFRGLLAGVGGVLLSTVGLDMVSGRSRFTFGLSELSAGLSFIPAMIGLFGLSEVLRAVARGPGPSVTARLSEGATGWPEVLRTVFRRRGLALRSSLVGTLIGALPGAGADIAAWCAYGLAQRTSRQGGEFGRGAVEGVIAPTSANNAAVAGAWIPALVLGIPGDSVTAIVLGALLMYHIRPGPLIFEQQAEQVRHLLWIAAGTQLLLLPVGYAGIRAFSWMLRLPRSTVLAGVVVFCVLGSYAVNSRLWDVGVMIGFGLLGVLLEAWRVPLGPLILGMILGPLVEEKLRVGLIKSEGSLLPFFTRPLCLAMVALLLLGWLAPHMLRRLVPAPRAANGEAP
jgi:TctA family transporter